MKLSPKDKWLLCFVLFAAKVDSKIEQRKWNRAATAVGFDEWQEGDNSGLAALDALPDSEPAEIEMSKAVEEFFKPHFDAAIAAVAPGPPAIKLRPKLLALSDRLYGEE